MCNLKGIPLLLPQVSCVPQGPSLLGLYHIIHVLTSIVGILNEPSQKVEFLESLWREGR